jgi:hypothetical protein
MSTTAVHSPTTLGDNLKTEIGTVATVAAADVVQTKLRKVLGVVLTPADDPVAGASRYTAVPSGLENGKFTLKGWKDTAAGDTTPIAATTFGKSVGYIAFGY